MINSVRISLRKIANRIDKGFNIEVRVEPFGENNENELSEQNNTKIHYIEKIIEASESFQFLKMEGEPILLLPEETEKENKISS